VDGPSRPARRRIDWGGLPSPERLRAGAGLLLGAVVATFGAFVLGEYEFEGWLPIGAGLLFGAVVAEIVVEVGRRRTLPVAVATAVIVAGGLLWAGWISAGEGLEPIPGGAKLAAAVGSVIAGARTFDWRGRPRAEPNSGH
jgi:hypothetical protein